MDQSDTEASAGKQGVGARRLLTVGLAVGLIGLVGLAIAVAQPAVPTGLANPAATPAPAPSTPRGIPDEATIAHYMSLGQAKYGAGFMSPAEARDPDARRLATYYLMVDEEADRRKAAAGGGRRAAAVKMSFVEVEAYLGEAAYADQEALAAKVKAAEKRN